MVLIALAMTVFGTSSAFAQRAIGIDVSDYQSPGIDWLTLKNSYGISFAWAKASEGGSTSGGTNYTMFYATNAKAAGVIIGPYHFARYDLNAGTSGAIAEANFFWNTVKNNVTADGLTLMPMLDVEASTTGQTQASLSLWVDTWCTTVSNSAYAAGLHIKPCIYASSSFANTWFDSAVTNWNTDIADWPTTNHSTALSIAQADSGPPAGITPWSAWTFWQYDDENAAQASTAGDGDIFNGTLAQLQSSMLVTLAGPGITAQPANLSVPPGVNATFTVSATGATSYQWAYNGANIPGATTSSYTVSNAQPSNAGSFSVITSNSLAGTPSSIVYLTVLSNAPGAGLAPPGMVNWWPADGSPVDIYSHVNGSPQPAYAPGTTGQAFSFDGNTSVINISAPELPVPWTACMWVNRQNSPQTSAALLGDNTYSLKLEQYNNTRNVGFTQLSVADYVLSPPYSVPVGVWTHLAFVGTSGGVSLYVNGVLTSSLANSIPLPRSYIGATYVTSPGKYIDFMLGSLDEIMIFNRALSVGEIVSIYSAGSAGLVKAAQFTTVTPTAPGQVTFGLQGQTGKNISLYSSPDLSHWSFFGAVANPSGATQFIDNNVSNNAQIFYRASQPY